MCLAVPGTIAGAGFALTRIDEETAEVGIATMTDHGVSEVPS